MVYVSCEENWAKDRALRYANEGVNRLGETGCIYKCLLYSIMKEVKYPINNLMFLASRVDVRMLGCIVLKALETSIKRQRQ